MLYHVGALVDAQFQPNFQQVCDSKTSNLAIPRSEFKRYIIISNTMEVDRPSLIMAMKQILHIPMCSRL
ncbi:unnamed protein product [Acanthoscelides obtectus]|uniref:Uncharacterized protein n=1 Tax=Acanthoscelides obtectus TaxID=200917 RepID=A0A9P0PJ36_ACAOB|nr:unnamed protein product [Acanthoscelides obtectus]CAK1673155.1 hypothetical protein AOBTE_LOCUS29252 [Acanthoscelides obtectus]